MKVRVVVVVVPVHGAGGVGGALASPFGDGEWFIYNKKNLPFPKR